MSTISPKDSKPTNRLYEIILDEKSINHANANVNQERQVAIFDLLENNTFEPIGRDDGPYRLLLSIADRRLVFCIGNKTQNEVMTHLLSLTPFRRIIRDYFLICSSYFSAITTAPPSRIQALDVGRKALHDEGSTILRDRLSGKIKTDFDTARRLFTLICALHWKG